MNREDIIRMAQESGFSLTHSGIVKLWLANGADLERFAQLVADKARRELREEIVYTWVPPHFVDMAVEGCAERAWLALVKHKQPWNVRQDVTDAILAKDKQ